MSIERTKSVVIGIRLQEKEGIWSAEDSLQELSELAKTAGLDVVDRIQQARPYAHPKYYLGEGKLLELKTLCTENGITLVICDDELSPNQQKCMEKLLQIQVIDRTSLILDIFASRAKTYEAQLQVEQAQLTYLLPRLTRLWTHLSRQGSGVGARGPGETQLEVDKRQIRKRLTHLKEKLHKVREQRQLRHASRDKFPPLSGAIIGYTNSGKSTLMNRLTDAKVLAEDKLFATLDPTTRQLMLPSNECVLISDTVGFIQKLPHHLVDSFHSTLEEVSQADFLIHVIDTSHPYLDGVIQTSLDLIHTLHADTKPQLYLFNKWDLVAKPNTRLKELEHYQPQLTFSALNDTNLLPFLTAVDSLLAPFKLTETFFIPYNRMDIFNLLHTHGHVLSVDYGETIKIVATIHKVKAQKVLSLLSNQDFEDRP